MTAAAPAKNRDQQDTTRMTAARKNRLVVALHTANQWSCDSSMSDLGPAMLSLGTTRTVHDENHRDRCIREIRINIRSIVDWSAEKNPAVDDYPKEVARLADLWSLVKEAELGKEWLTDAEHNRINEILYKKGRL